MPTEIAGPDGNLAFDLSDISTLPLDYRKTRPVMLFDQPRGSELFIWFCLQDKQTGILSNKIGCAVTALCHDEWMQKAADMIGITMMEVWDLIRYNIVARQPTVTIQAGGGGV